MITHWPWWLGSQLRYGHNFWVCEEFEALVGLQLVEIRNVLILPPSHTNITPTASGIQGHVIYVYIAHVVPSNIYSKWTVFLSHTYTNHHVNFTITAVSIRYTTLCIIVLSSFFVCFQTYLSREDFPSSLHLRCIVPSCTHWFHVHSIASVLLLLAYLSHHISVRIYPQYSLKYPASITVGIADLIHSINKPMYL